jgi:hypothetical protein
VRLGVDEKVILKYTSNDLTMNVADLSYVAGCCVHNHEYMGFVKGRKYLYWLNDD